MYIYKKIIELSDLGLQRKLWLNEKNDTGLISSYSELMSSLFDDFNFDDFLSQLEQVKKMGNIKDLMGMIPGMGKAMKGLDIDEVSFKPIEAIIRSMTPKERQNPDCLDGRRRKRIADGSGRSIIEVNNLMKQFEDMRKMMKQMNKMGGAKAAMSKLLPPGGRR